MDKNKIRENFDKAFNSYEENAAIQKESAKKLIQFLLLNTPDINPKKILDIGTGTGYIPEELFGFFPHADYMLNDLSPNMLKYTENKLKKYPNVAFHLSDAEEANFEETDLIISNLAFQWFKDLTTTLFKLWKSTNILAFSTLIDSNFLEWREITQKFGINCKLHNYPDFATLETICKKLNPRKAFLTTNTYNLSFPNILSFIRYLRNIGANTPSTTHSSNNLKSCLKLEQKSFDISYRIFFAVLIK